MAPSSLKKTYQSYEVAGQKLEDKLKQLRLKRDELDARAFTVLDEGRNGRGSDGSSGRGRTQHLQEEGEIYRTDVSVDLCCVSSSQDIQQSFPSNILRGGRGEREVDMSF